MLSVTTERFVGNAISSQNFSKHHFASRSGCLARARCQASVRMELSVTRSHTFLALRKDTGDVDWQSEGLGATSWSSPRLITVAGQPQLICSASVTSLVLIRTVETFVMSFLEISEITLPARPFPWEMDCSLSVHQMDRGEQSKAVKLQSRRFDQSRT